MLVLAFFIFHNMRYMFTLLRERADGRTVKVVRSGQSREIPITDILVGDVVHLNVGDTVPVDGIFISGQGVRCDEASATGASELAHKAPGDEVFVVLRDGTKTDWEILDPFIISRSKVVEGYGTFLVTAVGANSTLTRTDTARQMGRGMMKIQTGFSEVTWWTSVVGSGAAFAFFLMLFIRYLIRLPGNPGSSADKGFDFLSIFALSLIVLLVATPHGTATTLVIAFVFAIVKMLKKNILVRDPTACETMGRVTTICLDKTGTLTTNEMTLVAATFGKAIGFGSRKNNTTPLFHPPDSDDWLPAFVNKLSPAAKSLIIQSNLLNSTGFEVMKDGGRVIFGSKTEAALLSFCGDYLGARRIKEVRASFNVVQLMPFDSRKGYSAVCIKLVSKYRVYFKGAAEILFPNCDRILKEPTHGPLTPVVLSGTTKNQLEETIKSFSGQGLRIIVSCYREFGGSWPPMGAANWEFDGQANFDALLRKMILISIYGIRNPLRPQVLEDIEACERAGIVTRMVTGDSYDTASSVAKECGIFSTERGDVAIEGPELRHLTQEELVERVKNLKVVARCSPGDKRALVQALKDAGETVAVTGDGLNDAPALKAADVGISMGLSGTQVAMEASSIVIMDDE